MKPFLIFGLRGTLVERLHVRNIPTGMPEPHLNVGLTRVWLRHDVLSVLLALQTKCHLAIWSSTTARNTKALIDGVFNNEEVWKKNFPEKFGSNQNLERAARDTAAAAAATLPENAKSSQGIEKGRFSRRKSAAEEASSPLLPVTNPSFVSPIKFEFIWTREHTAPDEFRRSNAVIREDSHATIKDLNRVYAAFPDIATPQNTILIDDTPSKAKNSAANFLWVDSCQDLGVTDRVGMRRLLEFVEKDLSTTKDVRCLLPQRIRNVQ